MSSPGVRGHWSDGDCETSALIEAWGQLYLHRSRGSLRGTEWHQVCGAVNAHRAAAGCRFDRSVVQCQKRVYTLKDQYNKELDKRRPTPGWRHFAQLRAFLAGPDDGPPPGFAAKRRPPASSVEEEEEEEEAGKKVEKKEEMEEEASGSVGRRTVPAKRHFSSIQETLDRSDSLPSRFPTRMPATVNKEKGKEKEKVEEVKEEVGREGPANGAASAAAVVTKLAEVVTELPALVTKLAEVYERVEMERLGVEKAKMEMEWEGETDN